MSIVEAIATKLHKRAVINVGSNVLLPDGKTYGKVDSIGASPFYPECNDTSIKRWYVVNLDGQPPFGDYFLAEELQFVAVRS